MKLSIGGVFMVICLFLCMGASAQRIEEDTTTNQPFFHAKKFKSACYVGIEAQVTQVLKNKAGMNTGFNLNWVVNHKYVLSARYQTLSSRFNITQTVAPNSNKPVYLVHHLAGIGFSYILFPNKKFSFQPELTGAWCSIKFEYPTDRKNREDYGAIIPAVYGTYNATKYFRLGVGLNYRQVFGPQYYGLTAADLSGIAGVIFLRVGTF